MIYFKAFDKNMNVKKGSVIGSMETNEKGIQIYINPIFVINPTKNLDIFIVKPIGRKGKSNGDSVNCKCIEVGDKIKIEDMLKLDISIDYKLNIVRRIFDKDIEKRYELFNHIYDVDITGEMLYKYAKCFPKAINHKLMYSLIEDRDTTGTFISKYTVLMDGYNSKHSYDVAVRNKNYRAIVYMARHGIHSELAVLYSEIIKNCNDIIALKEFLEYVKNFSSIDTRLIINKISYLEEVYCENVV